MNNYSANRYPTGDPSEEKREMMAYPEVAEAQAKKEEAKQLNEKDMFTCKLTLEIKHNSLPVSFERAFTKQSFDPMKSVMEALDSIKEVAGELSGLSHNDVNKHDETA